MFPSGAVVPDNLQDLLHKTRQFLTQPPRVEDSSAFLLDDSMRRTLAVYQSLIKKPQGDPAT
jgi:hypothetical protein